jgi:allantoinase
MAAFDVRIDAARAVLDDRETPVTLGLRAGRVCAVERFGSSLSAAETVRLGDDVVLLPGLVDTHVHIDEPGRTGWEGFASATRAAAAGGVTTLVDMPLDCKPVTTSAAALSVKRAAAVGRCFVDVAFWGGVIPGNGLDLQALRAAGVAGFKCFLADSGNPDFPPVEESTLRFALRVARSTGVPLLVHAEAPDVLAAAPVARGPRYADYLASRPSRAESCAVAAVVDAVLATGGAAHIVHVSSSESVDLIRGAQASGLPVTAETCPHYLTIDSDQIPDSATAFACAPPIRSSHDADALWSALREGVIGMVVSDHSPCAAELKTEDFGTTWGGISSLQLALPVMWTAAGARAVTLVDLVRWMAQRPAQLAGLDDKGSITVGAAADLCVFDPAAEFVVDPLALHHRQPVTPYAGRRLRGQVRETWLAGRRIEPAGRPTGQLLSRRVRAEAAS